MNTAQETDLSREERWTAAGLAGYRQIEGATYCDPDWMIRGTDGKIIICRNMWGEHIADALTSILGKKIDTLQLELRDCYNATVFLHGSCHDLMYPEKHTLMAFVSYFDKYRPGFRAEDGDVNFPHALHALAAPANFMDETDAFQLAAALDELFLGTPDIMNTNEGYAVVVHDEDGDLNGWASERIAAVADVVSNFNLTPKRKKCYGIEGGAEEGYSAAAWQTRVAERYTQQQRIEDGVTAILAALVGSEAANAVQSHDAHRRPTKPSRKTKAGK